jgi:hypothetical protein
MAAAAAADAARSPSPTDEATFYTQIKNDFKVKDASFFTGTWGEQAKWPRLLVFCASDIPLTHEQYKKNAVMNKVLPAPAHVVSCCPANPTTRVC